MAETPTQQTAPGRPKSRRTRAIYEGGVRTILFGCSAFSILTTFAIIIVLFQQTAGFFGLHGEDTPGAVNHHPVAVAETPTSNRPRLNEIRLGQAGDKPRRYIEILGPPDDALADLTYIALGRGEDPGDAGVVRAAVNLDGAAPDASGYLLVASTRKVYGARADIEADLEFDESMTTTHLLVRGFRGAAGDDLDTDDDGALDATPWSDVVDAVAMIGGDADARWYADAVVGPLSDMFVPPHAVRDVETGEWLMKSNPSIHVSPIDFLFGTEWNPLLGAEKRFGVWPLVVGTLLVATVAMMIAIPFGLITAIFLSEYAPRRVRAVLKPTLEILAGIPTVVYGFFALTVITPALRGGALWITGLFTEDPTPLFGIYNAFSAGAAVGIMCLPIVSSLSEDALQAVPRSLREGAHALGGTRFDVSVKVVVPAALSGVVAAFLLAIARAVGETMIVALAAGNAARLSFDPTQEAQTMTAYMVQIFMGDASNFSPEYYSAYAVGATLFVMTFILTLIGARVLKRYREVYE